MSEARQYVQQIPGTMAGSGDTTGDGLWETSATYNGTGECYWNTQPLDLRGLRAGDEQGLQPENISLQEACPWFMPVASEFVVVVYDFISTVKPTQHLIDNIYVRPDTGLNTGVGFPLPGSSLSADWPPTRQRLNPSQVTWGIWRMFASDPNWKAGITNVMRVAQSGYFGQGDMAVSPALYWTRVVCTMTTEDTVAIPSANLLTYARAHKITPAQEMTAMMRAAQR